MTRNRYCSSSLTDEQLVGGVITDQLQHLFLRWHLHIAHFELVILGEAAQKPACSLQV